jgi:outer membrane receptor for ferrienterochelin and colicins
VEPEGPEGKTFTVVVTGARAERRLTDSPVVTELITRKDIEAAGAENLADVLEEHPGLDVFRGVGGAAVRVQGLDPQYVLLLVDGERINGRVNDVIDLTRFQADDIERVEILRGSASALYGADAIGGVINVITRKARKAQSLEGHLAYGTFNQVDSNLQLGLRREAFSARVSGGYHRSDGFDLDPTDVATNGPRFDSFNLSGRGDYAGERLTLGLKGEYLYRNSQRVDPGAGGGIFDRTNRTETLEVALLPRLKLAEQTALSGGVSYSLFRDQFLLDQRLSDALDQYQETWEHLGSVHAQLDTVLAQRHQLSVGLEGLYERLKTDRLGGTQSQRFRGAVYAADEWKVLDTLVLNPGLRLDGDSQFGAALSPRLAVRYDPLPALVLRASYGLGFRAPGFRELYLDFQNPGVGYIIEGNPALKPERSRSLNVGADWKPSRVWVLSLNGFRNDIDGLIQTTTVDAGGGGQLTRYRYENLASAWTMGLESIVRISPISALSFEGSYTLTASRDVLTDVPLEGRALHRGSVDVRGRLDAAGLDATVRAGIVGARPFYFEVDAAGVPVTTWAPTYVSLDVRLNFKVPGGLFNAYVLAENLLNAGDVRFLLIQPRCFSVGLTVRP